MTIASRREVSRLGERFHFWREVSLLEVRKCFMVVINNFLLCHTISPWCETGHDRTDLL